MLVLDPGRGVSRAEVQVGGISVEVCAYYYFRYQTGDLAFLGTCRGRVFFCDSDCLSEGWKEHKTTHGCRKKA